MSSEGATGTEISVSFRRFAAWRAGPAAIGPETTSTDFIAEAYYPTPLTAAARITHVNERDIGIASALFQKGHCVGLHQSRVVSWAPDGQPVPLSADLRAAFARRMAAQPPLPPGGEPEAGHKPALAHPGDAAGGAPADSMQVLHRLPADFPAHYPLASRFGDHDATGRTSDQGTYSRGSSPFADPMPIRSDAVCMTGQGFGAADLVWSGRQ